jgi:hypothetical protein
MSSRATPELFMRSILETIDVHVPRNQTGCSHFRSGSGSHRRSAPAVSWKWARPDSNRGPSLRQSDVIATRLRARYVVGVGGPF